MDSDQKNDLFKKVKQHLLTPDAVYQKTLIKQDTLKRWRLRNKLKENIDYIKLGDRNYLYLADSIYKIAKIIIL